MTLICQMSRKKVFHCRTLKVDLVTLSGAVSRKMVQVFIRFYLQTFAKWIGPRGSTQKALKAIETPSLYLCQLTRTASASTMTYQESLTILRNITTTLGRWS